MQVDKKNGHVKSLLTDTITLMCKSSVHYTRQLTVDALIAINIDEDHDIVVKITDKTEKKATEKEKDTAKEDKKSKKRTRDSDSSSEKSHSSEAKSKRKESPRRESGRDRKKDKDRFKKKTSGDVIEIKQEPVEYQSSAAPPGYIQGQYMGGPIPMRAQFGQMIPPQFQQGRGMPLPRIMPQQNPLYRGPPGFRMQGVQRFQARLQQSSNVRPRGRGGQTRARQRVPQTPLPQTVSQRLPLTNPISQAPDVTTSMPREYSAVTPQPPQQLMAGDGPETSRTNALVTQSDINTEGLPSNSADVNNIIPPKQPLSAEVIEAVPASDSVALTEEHQYALPSAGVADPVVLAANQGEQQTKAPGVLKKQVPKKSNRKGKPKKKLEYDTDAEEQGEQWKSDLGSLAVTGRMSLGRKSKSAALKLMAETMDKEKKMQTEDPHNFPLDEADLESDIDDKELAASTDSVVSPAELGLEPPKARDDNNNQNGHLPDQAKLTQPQPGSLDIPHTKVSEQPQQLTTSNKWMLSASQGAAIDPTPTQYRAGLSESSSLANASVAGSAPDTSQGGPVPQQRFADGHLMVGPSFQGISYDQDMLSKQQEQRGNLAEVNGSGPVPQLPRSQLTQTIKIGKHSNTFSAENMQKEEQLSDVTTVETGLKGRATRSSTRAGRVREPCIARELLLELQTQPGNQDHVQMDKPAQICREDIVKQDGQKDATNVIQNVEHYIKTAEKELKIQETKTYGKKSKKESKKEMINKLFEGSESEIDVENVSNDDTEDVGQPKLPRSDNHSDKTQTQVQSNAEDPKLQKLPTVNLERLSFSNGSDARQEDKEVISDAFVITDVQSIAPKDMAKTFPGKRRSLIFTELFTRQDKLQDLKEADGAAKQNDEKKQTSSVRMEDFASTGKDDMNANIREEPNTVIGGSTSRTQSTSDPLDIKSEKDESKDEESFSSKDDSFSSTESTVNTIAIQKAILKSEGAIIALAGFEHQLGVKHSDIKEALEMMENPRNSDAYVGEICLVLDKHNVFFKCPPELIKPGALAAYNVDIVEYKQRFIKTPVYTKRLLQPWYQYVESLLVKCPYNRQLLPLYNFGFSEREFMRLQRLLGDLEKSDKLKKGIK